MDFCVGLLCGCLISLVVAIITMVIEIRRFNKKNAAFHTLWDEAHTRLMNAYDAYDKCLETKDYEHMPDLDAEYKIYKEKTDKAWELLK